MCLIAKEKLGSYVVVRRRSRRYLFRFMSTHAENDAVKNDEIRRQERYAGSGGILLYRHVITHFGVDNFKKGRKIA